MKKQSDLLYPCLIILVLRNPKMPVLYLNIILRLRLRMLFNNQLLLVLVKLSKI